MAPMLLLGLHSVLYSLHDGSLDLGFSYLRVCLVGESIKHPPASRLDSFISRTITAGCMSGSSNREQI